METLRRFFKEPNQSYFLLGPRGTGKSTMLITRHPNALYVDLLQPELYRRMVARPEALSELALGSPRKNPVIIDEIQRVPELLNAVHHLMEGDKNRRFILTGSSARKLRRGGVNLLAGRALHRTLHPFMAAEVPQFDLKKALQIGMLPLILASPDPESALQAYIHLYLKEEVQVEGWARNVGHFARFLEVASFSHGAVLSVANVARECELERKTVEGYLGVLEDLLLAFRVPVFSKRAVRATAVHPKFYFFDTGVYRALRPRGPLDRAQEIEGCAFEGLVAQHLKAWIAYGKGDCTLYYWRTRHGLEVDFVVYGAGGFWAVEVKNSTKVRQADLSGLRAFVADYPECRPLLIYRGREHLMIGDISCMPGEEFLRGLKASSDLLVGFR